MPRTHMALIAAFLAIVALATPASSQTISWPNFAAEVGAGLQTSAARARLSDGQHGGITVRIESADSLLVLVTADQLTPGAPFVDIFLPNGDIDATFYVQALEDTTGMVQLTATATGFSAGLDSIEVVVPALRTGGLATSRDPYDTDDPFSVSVGVPNAGNTSLSPAQKVRVGGPGLTATVTNSSAPTAQLVTTALTAQVVSVAISPGETSSPSSVALGGVAFDGLAPGATDVDVTIPGFNPLNSLPVAVTVTAPIVTMINFPVDVGSGLQVSGKRARLSGSQHGGLTMHLASSDSNLVLLALGRYDAGAATLDVFLDNGEIDVVFYVQALEDTVGSSVVTGSATGFADGFGVVNVVTPYFRLSGLNSSIDTLDPTDAFNVSVGLPSGSFTTISPSQQVRGGGATMEWIVTSSVDTVGVLETLSTLDDTATVFIVPGNSTSPSNVASGGVAFDGIGAGVTQVTASHPGFVPVSTGIVDVTVTQPTISFSNQPTMGLGAGLQPTTTYRANLSASQHGGVTVHIETPDTNLALISADGISVGGSSIDVFLANGSTQAAFYLQGIEDTTGVVNITGSAPGFVGSILVEDLIQPSLKIATGLAGAIDTIDPPDPFRVQVGVANSVNHFVQKVRPGSPGVVATITLDDSLVAELQTLADTSHTVTVTVAAGQSLSPNTVASGGVAFNGLSPGVVEVSTSTPGYIAWSQASKTVTVNAPSLNITANLGSLGAGLQKGYYNVTLSASNHGGVTVSIVSLDPQIALVSVVESNAGLAVADVFVPDGSASARYWVHGIDDTTGAFTVMVTAPLFTPDTSPGEVVVPGVEILSLSPTIDVIDPTDQFYAQVGLPASNNSTVTSAQDRRAGEPPLIVTLISSNGIATELVTTSETNDTVTVSIVAGTDNSPTTIAAGGVGLNGLASGQTVVTAQIPGFITTGDGQRVVDVSNQNVFINGLTSRLGSNLQSVAASAELGEPLHGGTTVHIELDDSLMALVSANALVAGDRFVDVVLPNGDTEAVFYLQALDTTGNVTVTVSAPTFVTKMQIVDLVTPGIEIFGLADSLATTDPDDEFVVRIGAVNGDSSGIHEAQALRGGGPSRTLTIASSDGTLAFIVQGNTLDASRDFVLNPGEFETPSPVSSGGFALTPWNVGVINVTASMPGFVTTDRGMPTVTLTGTPTGVGEQLPVKFELAQNIPNPFNPVTTIRFSTAAAGMVDLTIYDVAGRRVATLLHGEMPAGQASVQWNGRSDNGTQVSTGVYFYRLTAGANVETRKMLLLK